MRRRQSGQALVEWAVVSFVLLLLGLGILALGQIVGEYMAIRSASSQAAFAAARAPSEKEAQGQGHRAALQAVAGSSIEDFSITVDTHGFQRGGVVTVNAQGQLSLANYPIVRQVLGERMKLSWTSNALIEPYRSRAP
jgi:Flp pilus assembly protein TadG